MQTGDKILGYPVVFSEHENAAVPLQRTGIHSICYELRPGELDMIAKYPRELDWIRARLKQQMYAYLADRIDDGRAYCVKVEKSELLSIPHGYDPLFKTNWDLPPDQRPHIGYSVTVALANFEDAKPGEHYIERGKMHVR